MTRRFRGTSPDVLLMVPANNPILSAYVVPSTKDITALEIVEWVNGQVSNPKKLRGGVVFLAEIPKSPSGKILRRELRERAKKGEGSKL